MRWTALLSAVGLLLIGCSGSDDDLPRAESSKTPSPEVVETFSVDAAVVTLNGMAIVEQELDGQASTDCEDLSGKFAVLGVGEQLKLLDASGEVVAVAALEASQLEAPENVCAWDATFEDVPAGGGFYSTSIGEWESAAHAEDELPSGRIVINAE